MEFASGRVATNGKPSYHLHHLHGLHFQKTEASEGPGCPPRHCPAGTANKGGHLSFALRFASVPVTQGFLKQNLQVVEGQKSAATDLTSCQTVPGFPSYAHRNQSAQLRARAVFFLRYSSMYRILSGPGVRRCEH